ncbi:nucleoside hydrolase [Bacillus seohaeanensis]|uniref:Nucleoside hydrolase n=1 Tax=Bacillus seohaeanensis TaxID=284580 RepID=A0ABW5RWI7_9BACI
MKKILLFADPGIDDSIAIIYALLNPEIEVVGIVSSYGNVDKKQATENVAYLLELANKTDIPIIGGTTRPFSGEIPTFYPEIHGPEGLGPIVPPENIAGELLNFTEIFNIIDQNPGLTIVDVGRNTSLATAVILSDDLSEKVKEFYIMGGAFLVPGNVTPYAEANFYGDPVASSLVFDSLKNITVIPLNVSNNSIVTKQHVATIQESTQNPLIDILDEVMDYYINAYKKLIPGLVGAPLHDVVTLSLLANPDMGRFIYRDVQIQQTGKTKGVSIADLRVKPEDTDKNVRIYLELDYPLFLEDFIRVMSTKIPTE